MNAATISSNDSFNTGDPLIKNILQDVYSDPNITFDKLVRNYSNYPEDQIKKAFSRAIRMREWYMRFSDTVNKIKNLSSNERVQQEKEILKKLGILDRVISLISPKRIPELWAFKVNHK